MNSRADFVAILSNIQLKVSDNLNRENKLFAYPFLFFWFLNHAINDLNVSAAVELFLVTLAHSALLGLVVAAPRVASVVTPLDDTVITS